MFIGSRSMRYVVIAVTMLFGVVLADVRIGAGQPFPSTGSPNPAMIGVPVPSPSPNPAVSETPAASPPGAAATPSPDVPLPPGSAPRAVTVARTTTIPRCTVFVDAAAVGRGDGMARNPHKTIAAAVAATPAGAVICVAEGVYAEQLKPGEKYFTLAGGFQRGSNFAVRDSARYVSKAQGRGGSFIRVEDPAPKGNQLTAIDGFEIAGYSQAIYRDTHYSQRFDVTNNHIHDNRCANTSLAGGGFALNNVSGRIQGNVLRNNACGRGGAGFLNDAAKENTVVIDGNLIDGNAGTEPDSSHGGALYLFGKTIRITANLFTRNTVTRWGAALYVGADTGSSQHTSATLNWNVYRGNSAGVAGGGLFCDDGATCLSFHEIYDRNCGGNIYLDSGSGGGGPTIARFDHLTNVGALDAGCKGPGPGVRIDRDNNAPDAYSFVNAIFRDNAPGQDFAANCDRACNVVKVNVSYSLVQTRYAKNGLTVTFGAGNIAPIDPLFADSEAGDFHLKSAQGRWTPAGYVRDSVTSPLLGKGYPEGAADQNPERAGNRNELGAYGNSGEASYSR
jgi:hypothetical protein